VSDVMVGLGEEVTYFAAMVSSRISKSCSKRVTVQAIISSLTQQPPTGC